MRSKSKPESPVAIQAELTYLRHRKRVLDELIECLERYAEDNFRPPRRACGRVRGANGGRKRAGAA